MSEYYGVGCINCKHELTNSVGNFFSSIILVCDKCGKKRIVKYGTRSMVSYDKNGNRICNLVMAPVKYYNNRWEVLKDYIKGWLYPKKWLQSLWPKV